MQILAQKQEYSYLSPLEKVGCTSENSKFIWFFVRFALPLQQKTKEEDKNMLGIDTPHKPIEGKFAEEIREVVHRMSTGRLNEADKRRIRRSKKVLQRYNAVWE